MLGFVSIVNDLFDRCSGVATGTHAASAGHVEPYHRRSEASLGDQAGRHEKQPQIDAKLLAETSEHVRVEIAGQRHAETGEQRSAAISRRDGLGDLLQT